LTSLHAALSGPGRRAAAGQFSRPGSRRHGASRCSAAFHESTAARQLGLHEIGVAGRPRLMFYAELDPVYLCLAAHRRPVHPELDLLAGRHGRDQERKVLVEALLNRC